MKHLELAFFIGLITISFNAISQTNLNESKMRGQGIYDTNCVTCHMANGEGITGAFPPLAKSDYLMADTKRSIKTILEGANGEMKVNGTTYYGAMVGYNTLTDQEIADVLNYVRNSWGNDGKVIEPELVSHLRK